MSLLPMCRPAAFAVTVLVAIAFTPSVSGAAQATVDLGAASSFAVLAGEGITNANETVIVGDVGTFPNPAQTGFESVTLTGTNHHDDEVSEQAKTDLVAAYDQAAAAGPAASVAVELGGTTLKPGVYNGATLEITGTLTLDTEGDPSAVFIFQSGSSLTTASGSSVAVLDGAIACNVFWQLPSSADLGTNSHLIGTVLASTAIVARSGATIDGRLLAQTASVTLDHNTITASACAATTPPDDTVTPSALPSDAGTDSAAAAGLPTSTATSLPTTETALASAPAGPPASATPPRASVPSGPSGPSNPAAPGMPAGPPLAVTGIDVWLAALGSVLLVAGLGLVRLTGARHRPLTAMYVRWAM